ncbi:MAG TPA: ABC transporter permease [Myxococcaceae bacterium]|jgi:predicted permease
MSSWLDRATRRLRLLTGRRGFEQQLDEELRFHLEMEARRHEEQGLSPQAARALAEREFGRVERYKDEVRDVRGITWMDDVSRDVRFAWRTLRKSPTFVLVAVLCLAFGIGANAAIFSVLDAVLLRPLPYSEPDRLARLYETQSASGQSSNGSVSWANYLEWSEQVKGFSGITAYTIQSKNLSGPEGAERLKAVASTANLFDVLGVQPRLGRGFLPEEDASGAAQVVVLREGLWQRRFGANPSILGQTLTLDSQPYTVIGVMPEAARFPAGSQTDLFIPLARPADFGNQRGHHFLSVIGRLSQDVALETANSELRQVARRLEEAYPQYQTGRSATAIALAETVVGKVRPALLMLLGAVGLVLLIACANVANLLLARAASRRQEVAIRLALGASRARLVRQMLVEGMLLSLGGALLGLLLALWGLSTLESLVQRALPLAGGIPLQGRIFGFLLLVATGSAVLFGLVPALQATRGDLRSGLTGAGERASGPGSHHRFRNGLVVAEIALSLILLVGAGLLLRDFVTLLRTEPGLDASHVLTAHLPVPSGKFTAEQRGPRLFEPVLERARNLPGVKSAGLITLLPIQKSGVNCSYTLDGEPPPAPGQEPMAEIRFTSPDFFRSLGIPLLAGRDFTDEDGHQPELRVIINQAFARRHFPVQDAVGQRLRINGDVGTIIGVVADVRQAGLHQAPLTEMHIPYNHPRYVDWFDDVTLVLKTTVNPTSMTAALQDAVRLVDLEQPLYQVLTMEEVIGGSVAERRLNLLLLGTFALMALVLAITGLYGVIAYLVAQRTREIGIRVALGARTWDVVWLVMRQGGRLTALGIAVGILGALGLSRVMESLLHGVSARDPLTLGTLAALLGCVALVATWLPARRAARVDPVIAIKSD